MDAPNPAPLTPAHLLGVYRHQEPGYRPLVDFASWRVAILNFSQDLRVENIKRLQRHNETDEVFVLLAGRFLLLTAEGEECATRIHAEDLQAGLVYNVRRGVWHNHVLSPDARVLVVENRDTTYDNSPFTDLSAAQQAELARLCRRIWRQ